MHTENQLVYCVELGPYQADLTLHKAYEVLQQNDENHEIRLKGDKGIEIWIPDCYVNDTPSPKFKLAFESEHWDPDENWDPTNDFMFVWVTLPDGRIFNLNVWTFKYMKGLLENPDGESEVEKTYIIPPDLFVESLTRDAVYRVISDLMRDSINLDEYIHQPVLSLNFKDPWKSGYDLPDLGESLEIELRKEINEQHILYGEEVFIEAIKRDSNEVLFSFDVHKLALVELTWSGKLEEEGSPKTTIYQNYKHFWEACLND